MIDKPAEALEAIQRILLLNQTVADQSQALGLGDTLLDPFIEAI